MPFSIRCIAAFCLALAGLASASAQTRVEFQRQKFDRSRFDRAGQPATAPATPSAPAASPETFGLAAPDAPMAAPDAAPMVTQPPTAPDAASSSVFSYSNSPAPAGFSSTAPTNTTIFSADAPPLSGPPPFSYPPTATPEEKAVMITPLFEEVPAKWFNNAKDYEELRALQKKTGACMIVYFKNLSVPNEKGLCNWFEKSITTDIDWRKAMKYFIKLEINLPGGSAVRDLVDSFRVVKTPAIFVLIPGGTMPKRLNVFNYTPGARPEPIEVPTVLANLKTLCTPAYAPLF